jgi:hypothetical protein
MSYIRRKKAKDYKPSETKFEYDREVTSTRTTTRERINTEASILVERI